MKKVINKIYKIYNNMITIRLVVSKDNKSAIKLYEKLDFIIIKQVDKEKEKILEIKMELLC
jgi:ribosomal protein S18 acetylase RimI-like enzyme